MLLGQLEGKTELHHLLKQVYTFIFTPASPIYPVIYKKGNTFRMIFQTLTFRNWNEGRWEQHPLFLLCAYQFLVSCSCHSGCLCASSNPNRKAPAGLSPTRALTHMLILCSWCRQTTITYLSQNQSSEIIYQKLNFKIVKSFWLWILIFQAFFFSTNCLYRLGSPLIKFLLYCLLVKEKIQQRKHLSSQKWEETSMLMI